MSSFTKLTNDVSNVSKLPDKPTLETGYSAIGLKEIFDRAAVDIKNYINGILIAELEGYAYPGESGADKIGSGAISGLNCANNIRSQLTELKKQIDSVINYSIPSGSIAKSKLSSDVVNILDNTNLRHTLFKTAGSTSFTVPVTGIYKVTVVGGGGGGGGKDVTYLNTQCGGGSGACAVKWIQLTKGVVIPITVGQGGEGSTLDSDGRDTGGTSGTYSGFGTYMKAYGGPTIRSYSASPALSEGGDINICGGLGYIYCYSGSGVRSGAPSYLGNAAPDKNTPAGIGGGGFGCGQHGVNVGADGGDGAVLIEYVGAA